MSGGLKPSLLAFWGFVHLSNRLFFLDENSFYSPLLKKYICLPQHHHNYHWNHHGIKSLHPQNDDLIRQQKTKTRGGWGAQGSTDYVHGKWNFCSDELPYCLAQCTNIKDKDGDKSTVLHKSPETLGAGLKWWCRAYGLFQHVSWIPPIDFVRRCINIEDGRGGLTGMGVIDGSNFPASQARSPSLSFLVQLDGRRLKISEDIARWYTNM